MKMGTIFWLISTPRIDLTYGQSSLDRIPDNVYSTRVSFYPQLSEQEDGLTTSTSKIQHLRLRVVEQLRVCRAHCPSHPLRELLGRRANVEFCCLRVEVGLVGGDVIVVCSRLIVSGMAVMRSVMGVVIYVCHDFSSVQVLMCIPADVCMELTMSRHGPSVCKRWSRSVIGIRAQSV